MGGEGRARLTDTTMERKDVNTEGGGRYVPRLLLKSRSNAATVAPSASNPTAAAAISVAEPPSGG